MKNLFLLFLVYPHFYPKFIDLPTDCMHNVASINRTLFIINNIIIITIIIIVIILDLCLCVMSVVNKFNESIN